MIQVIERFHKILEYVSDAPETPRSLSELAKLIGVSAPACSNIVRTMVATGYLENIGDRKGYILGATPYYVTRNGQYKNYLTKAAHGILETLVQEIEELVVLVTECNGRRVELMKLNCDSMVQIKDRDTVSHTSLFGSATGCLLLSYMAESEFKFLWERHSSADGNLFRTDDYDVLLEKRREFVAAGCFIAEPEGGTEEQLMHKSTTLSFPVYENGVVVAAIGSRIPAYRFKGKRKEVILEKCKVAAQKVSEILNCKDNWKHVSAAS